MHVVCIYNVVDPGAEPEHAQILGLVVCHNDLLIEHELFPLGNMYTTFMIRKPRSINSS